MGSRIAPILAIVFMDRVKRSALKSAPLLYMRYIDDTLVVAKDDKELHKFFHDLNVAHNRIKFTVEQPVSDRLLI